MKHAEPATKAPVQRASRLRNAVALVLLSAVAGGCFSLGLWQLGRAAERDALHDAIERGRQQAPLALSAATPATELTPWRAAAAQGKWLASHTVLLENRNLGGRPGYWVATPLLLTTPPIPANRNDAISAGSAEIGNMVGDAPADDFLSRGPGGGTAAVLVLRGWLPRDMQASGTLPQVPSESGVVSVKGELHAHVPRIFELWEWAGGRSSAVLDRLPSGDGNVPAVQNLDLADYARATGLQLLPTVLAQTQDTIVLASGEPTQAPDAGAAQSLAAGADLLREWPGPSLDSDQNKGYALQWFSFSAIAAIAALFIMRNMLRRRPQQRSKETP